MYKQFCLLLLLLGGCNVQWDSILTNDHTIVDPNPPRVVTQPEFRLLIVEETADRPKLSPGQLSVFTSVTIREYLDKHCMKLADGSNGYRIVDKDQLDELPAEFRATVDAKNPPPWLYCTDGLNGLSCPLPTADVFIEKVRPYAEGK